jgi:crotonobetainyl-CoA:carnitine CoA-transferase CaiB-like acyl-CoA transferase
MTDVMPFADLRVLDLGTFWAGPFAGCYLGAFGADVIKVESVRRPDAFRYNTAFPQQGEDWYERSGLFQATNLNKRDLTLDLADPEARVIFDRLLASADVLLENFSPRVVGQLGLSYDHVQVVNPRLIMVRMPGFGTTGPWRDFVGFGNSFEHVGGLTAATGYPDVPPLGPGGYADPIVALHAVVAIQAALEQRERTGLGQLIELAQIEVVAALAAEPVLAYSDSGEVPARPGNRSPDFAPQGVYECADEDGWAAISVRDDEEWRRLVSTVGNPALAHADFATAAGRAARHDEIDRVLTEWTSRQDSADVESALLTVGIPVGVVLTPSRMYADPQLNAVGYYQTVAHPVTGERRYPGWAARHSSGPPTHHRFSAPTLGQHNDEILLVELDLDADTVALLRARGLVGEQLAD